MQVHHYDAATAPKGALRHLLPLVDYPALIWRHRYLVYNFFRRELLGRFRGTALGAFWILAQPLFLFTVYYLVFGMLFGNWRWGQLPDPHFAVYLFTGILVFQSLTEGTTQCCSVVVENGNLVKKVAFPSEVLAIHVVLVSLAVYCVGALVALIAGTALGVLQPGPALLGLPLVLAVHFVLTLGIGLFLANLNVFARDTVQLWRIATTAWMFLSPVFWMPSQLAEKLPPAVPTVIAALNPAYPLIQAHRIVLGGTDVQLGDFWWHLAVAATWATLFLIVGYTAFMQRRHRFADLI